MTHLARTPGGNVAHIATELHGFRVDGRSLVTWRPDCHPSNEHTSRAVDVVDVFNDDHQPVRWPVCRRCLRRAEMRVAAVGRTVECLRTIDGRNRR